MRYSYKYSCWAGNGQGASLSVVLPLSERRRSLRAYEDAARNQLGSDWTVHILRHNFDPEGDSYFNSEEVKVFRIR